MPNKALTTIGTCFKIFSRLIVFNFVDTFHEVKSKRERRKEVFILFKMCLVIFLFCLIAMNLKSTRKFDSMCNLIVQL